jgi:hypothetical protein
MIDWSDMRPKKKPTRRQRGRYQRWVRYLKDSRLSRDEVHSRAASYAEKGKEPPND